MGRYKQALLTADRLLKTLRKSNKQVVSIKFEGEQAGMQSVVMERYGRRKVNRQTLTADDQLFGGSASRFGCARGAPPESLISRLSRGGLFAPSRVAAEELSWLIDQSSVEGARLLRACWASVNRNSNTSTDRASRR